MLARIRSCLSYANVVATLAIFVALGGGAYAAITLPAHSVGSKQLKNKAVTPRKVAPKTIQLFKGDKGDPGPRGAMGTGGPPGPPGQPGSAAASALMSRSSVAIPFSNTNTYLPVSGFASYSDTEAGVTLVSPNAAIVARDLRVHEPSGNGGGNPRHYTLRVNGTDTALTCTTAGNLAESCSDSVHTVTIPAGSQLSIHFTRTLQGLGSGGVVPQIAWRATTP
jgi:hypothetical protein